VTRVRTIWTELVERKLWPVAAALVVALVAVPLLLASGGDKSAAPQSAAGASAVAANAHPAAVVSLEATPSSKLRQRGGHSRDPFVQQHVQAAAADASATTGAPSSTAGPATFAPTLPTDTVVTPYAPAPATVRAPHANSPYVYHAVVRVKQLGKVRYLHDVARFDYVPSHVQRYLMFLGVLSDRKTALFAPLVPMYVFGNARCRPRRAECATFELRAGGSELLTIPQQDGSVRRVRITLERIFAKATKATSSAAKAKSAKRSRSVLSGAAFIK
jgi:hypothetical protein